MEVGSRSLFGGGEKVERNIFFLRAKKKRKGERKRERERELMNDK